MSITLSLYHVITWQGYHSLTLKLSLSYYLIISYSI
nr:MAG TPA: hypothetical protein [Caudoviricetes sp.]